jgi:hypothetical protein
VQRAVQAHAYVPGLAEFTVFQGRYLTGYLAVTPELYLHFSRTHLLVKQGFSPALDPGNWWWAP